MLAVFITAALLWCCGAVVVLAPLVGAAARQLTAEARATARLLRRLTRR